MYRKFPSEVAVCSVLPIIGGVSESSSIALITIIRYVYSTVVILSVSSSIALITIIGYVFDVVDILSESSSIALMTVLTFVYGTVIIFKLPVVRKV